MTPHKTRNEAFFITPIGRAHSDVRDRADTVLECVLRPALVPDHVAEVVRVDKTPRSGFITSTVIEKIVRSRIVVADITGLNPNVFYELAIAHAAHVPVITIREPDSDIPFDISALNAIDCGLDIASGTLAISAIRSAAARLLENSHEVESPVKTALLLLNAGDGGAGSQSLEATVLRRLDQIETAISRLGDRRGVSEVDGLDWDSTSLERLDDLEFMKLVLDSLRHGGLSSPDFVQLQPEMTRRAKRRDESLRDRLGDRAAGSDQLPPRTR